MTDDQPHRQEAFRLDLRARLQEVEDLLMSMDRRRAVVRTANGSFEWRLGAIEEPTRREAPSTRRKVLRSRRR